VPNGAEPRRALDDVDRAIIGMLREDGRTTSRAIGAAIGLAETNVTARIRALLGSEALAITTVFDWERVGYRHDLWLKIRADGDPAPLSRTIAGMKGVHAVLRLTDPYDLLVHVLVPEQDGVGDFLSSQLAGTAGLGEVETAVTVRTIEYAVTLARLPVESSHFDFPDPAVELDELDHATLSALTRDGRQSTRQIARDLGVNEGTIRARIRRMESAGMLRICGQLNPLHTGPSASRAIIGVQTDVALGESVGRRAAKLPGITMVAMVTGRHNLIIAAGFDDPTQMENSVRRLRCLPGVRGIEFSRILDVVALDYHLARFVDPNETAD